jgi:hypothetical protein
MMRRSWLTGLIGMAVLALPSPVRPCDWGLPPAHVIDVAAQQVDRTPPSLAPMPAVALRRGPAPEGCGAQQITSCDGVGSLGITPVATDDRSAAAQIGFRLRVVAGNLPDGLTLPSTDIQASSGTIYLQWDDGIEDDHEAFSFTLELSAVDSAGNASAPVTLVVSDGGSDGGCAVGGGAAGAWWPMMLLVVVGGLARIAVRQSGRRQ